MENVKKRELHPLILQTQELHRRKELKNEKRLKDSAHHPIGPSKKELLALIIKKWNLIKYYFDVSVIMILFQKENKK